MCRYAAWAVLFSILVLILCTFLDYGITWDEELQSQYGQAVVDYYASGFRDLRYSEIFNLYLYGGMFDGLASLVDHYTPFQVYDTRHLVNALFGLLGLWGVWRLGKIIGGEVIGLIALLLCAAVPMYYGHMYNNPKDIPFAAGIIWTIYYMGRSYAKPEWNVLLKLAAVLGLTLGVRVGGAMICAFWLAPMGVVALWPLVGAFNSRVTSSERHAEIVKVSKNCWHLTWRVVLPVFAFAYVIMLFCWPWAQQHPIDNPLRALKEFSNFPQVVEVMLDGKNYLSTELPWYYVPLYFGVQLPELVLFLLGAFIVFLPKIWRDLASVQKQTLSVLILMMSFPIIYAVIRHPALYDTVRHFLFTVPLMCILAALAARTGFVWSVGQFRQVWARRAIGGFLCLAAAVLWLSTVFIMVRLHPYEYIYANRFAGGVEGAYGRYESDYWGTSFKAAAQQIQALVASEGGVPPGKIYKIAICGPWDAAMIYLPPDYEPVVANEPAEFFLSTTRWMCQDMRPGKEVIRIKRLGVPLAIVKDLRGGYEHYEGNEHQKHK